MARTPLTLAICALCLGASTATAGEVAVNPSVCQPYTASAPDHALLRMQPAGYVNLHAVSKFVICPVPKDAEHGWMSPGRSDWGVRVHFSMPSGWIPRLTSNQCTLQVMSGDESPGGPVPAAVTRNASQVALPAPPLRAAVQFTQDDFPIDPVLDGSADAVLVCRIAPGNTLTHIVLDEQGPVSLP